MVTEDEALELLALLITSARTQVDEAANYGTLRLLVAAERLGTILAERGSPATQEFAEGATRSAGALALQVNDRDALLPGLDALCADVARTLVDRAADDAAADQ